MILKMTADETTIQKKNVKTTDFFLLLLFSGFFFEVLFTFPLYFIQYLAHLNHFRKV